MIETLGTYSEIHRPPEEVEEWITDFTTPLAPIYGTSTGSLIGAVLSGEDTPLGFVRIVRPRAEGADAHTGYSVWAEGNLLSLCHGKAAKHLTLAAQDVPAAIDIYSYHLHDAVPIMTSGYDLDRLCRVDASVTWRHDPERASHALAQARAALHTRASGRKKPTTYGAEGTSLLTSKKQLIRVYDKTAETRHALRGSGVAPAIGDGTLVRLEVQERGTKARDRYGDNLTRLSRLGALMARIAVETEAEAFARALALSDPASQAARLVILGATPSEAARLMGPMQLLARGGIPALTSIGISLGSAYRIRARLDELSAVQDDPGAVEAGEDRWDALQQSLWDVDHAEYSDGDDS